MEITNQTEDELETFRRQWKEEVKAKNRKSQTAHKKTAAFGQSSSSTQAALKANATPQQPSRLPLVHGDQDQAERSYHDIEEKEIGRRVGDNLDTTATSTVSKLSTASHEPQTALEFFEKAAESEGRGRLGESLSDYRKAYKLDASVEQKYKDKYFPPPARVPRRAPGISNEAQSDVTLASTSDILKPISIQELIASFAGVSIEGEAPPTEFSPPPPCPIANIPEEVLVDILIALASNDLPSSVQLSQVSKRFAYLVTAEDTIWRRLIHHPDYGFPAMLYNFTCTIAWDQLLHHEDGPYTIEESDMRAALLSSIQPLVTLPLTPIHPTYRQMFRARPRIRFNGCYISTVNYTRPGGVGSSQSLTWNHNVLVVTYYRYLRFFRDGTLISLLTTAEPADVVPYLQKEYVRYQSHSGGQVPQIVMKDALKGRWRLSGDPFCTKAPTPANLSPLSTHIQQGPNLNVSSINPAETAAAVEPAEVEGDVHIETEGVVSKYKYIMQLRFPSPPSASSRTNTSAAQQKSGNNKLNWVGYWCHNKLTDDVGEFGLKNDRPYFWSRVRSWY